MDSFEGDPQSPASLHRYLYTDSDPVNAIDPSGEEIDLVSVVAVAGLAGFVAGTTTGLYLEKGLWKSLGYGLAGAVSAAGLTAGILTGGTSVAALAGVPASTGIQAVGGIVASFSLANAVQAFLSAAAGKPKNVAAVGLIIAFASVFLPQSAGTPELATEQDLINAISAEYQPSSGRAIRYSIYEADGRTGSAIAISGAAERPGTVSAPTGPKFSPVPTYEYDVEAKLLEDVATQLTPQSTGRIAIVINKNYVCMSCVKVVQQFKAAYPNVSVEIRTAGQRPAANPFD
jgi:hypothetical protein